MEHDEQNLLDRLLDWHLNRLTPDERSRFENELRQNTRLRAKCDRLGHILHPLDSWPAATAPPNLLDKVLRQVARQSPQATPHVENTRTFKPAGRVRELLAVAACVALLAGVLVPGVSLLRRGSQRALCASNLGSIFRGVSTYQQAFSGTLPFAGRVRGASWLPGGGSGKPYASNSRHLYLLLKTGFVSSPRFFVCPGGPTAKPMPTTHFARYDDFATAGNISYASLNMAGQMPNVRPAMPLAYIGDENPLFVNARFQASLDPDHTNSLAHGGRGQTVLTLDGSARWITSPLFGAQRDNLWLAGNIRRYTGVETPTAKNDVQLLPGYPVTDPAVARTLQH